MNDRDTLIWKYLDGDCSPEEQVRVETLMKEDAAFKAAVLQREHLHRNLQQQETEQPSLRFAKNVMDALPALYRKKVQPLVRPFWVKAFFGALGMFLVAYLGFVYYALETGKVQEAGPTTRAAEQISSAIEGLPPQSFTIIGALSLAYLCLVLLDRQLKRRWLN